MKEISRPFSIPTDNDRPPQYDPQPQPSEHYNHQPPQQYQYNDHAPPVNGESGVTFNQHSTQPKPLSSDVKNLISILKSDPPAQSFSQQGQSLKQTEQYSQLKNQINKYIKTCYQKNLEGRETFQQARQTAQFNMIHNRSSGRSCEMKNTHRTSDMFTPVQTYNRQRKESMEYHKNKGLNNSTGEIVMQTKRRLQQEKSQEKTKQFNSKGRVPARNTEQTEVLNARREFTFAERMQMNGIKPRKSMEKISNIFNSQETQTMKSSRGNDDFTKSRNIMQGQETKRVLGNNYVGGNQNIANRNAKVHHQFLQSNLEQRPNLGRH